MAPSIYSSGPSRAGCNGKLQEIDQPIPLMPKSKVYQAILITLDLMHGSEYWAINANNKRKIATTEIRMLRGVFGVSIRDHMRNDGIRRIVHLILYYTERRPYAQCPTSMVWGALEGVVFERSLQKLRNVNKN